MFVGFLLTVVVGGLLTNYYAYKQRKLDEKRQDQRIAADRAYLAQQKENERARAFADKVSEMRVQRIAAVWERLATYEAAASHAIEEGGMAYDAMLDHLPLGVTAANLQQVLQAQTPLGEGLRADLAARDPAFRAAAEVEKQTRELAARNRLWLGERRYGEVQKYSADIAKLLLDAKSSGSDMPPALEKRREELRITFASLRESWLDTE